MKKVLFIIMALLALGTVSVDAQKKKVHTIGDSTMDGSYDPATTYKRGWCMMLQQFLNSDNLQVNNRGKSGASSKSFYQESPYWPTLVEGGSDAMKAGDILLIQFAHNDEKNNGADGDAVKAYYTAQGDAAKAASTDYRGTVANTTYKEYIRKYIKEAKKMGVKPIVVGAICRKYFDSNGKIRRSGRHDLGDKFTICDGASVYSENNAVSADDHTYDYPYQSSLVAAEEEDVPYIDLTSLTAALYESYGDEYCTTQLFGPDDSTHPAALGATLIARSFAEGVKALYESEEYAKPENAKRKAVLKELYDNLVLSNDISFNPVTGDMGEAYVDKYAKKEFNISAFGLSQEAGKVTISVSDGFEFALDGSDLWTTIAECTYSGATFIKSITVRTKIKSPGTVTGVLTVSDGVNEKTLQLSAVGKSLVQGTETTCEWVMNTASTAATSELLNGKEATYSNMVMYNGTASPTSPEGHSKMAMFTTTDGTWPAGEIDENSNRYVQFQVTVPDGKEFYLDNISYEVGAWGGNGLCYHAYYATKADFSDQVFMDEKKNMTNKAANAVVSEANATVGEGESLYIRFYPWYSSAQSGKYLTLSNLKVHGTLAEAGGVNIEGTVTRAQVGKNDAPVYDPETLGACFVSATTTIGSALVENGSKAWIGAEGNGTMLTSFKNTSGATTSSSANDANTITFTYTPADGYTFMPSHVSLQGGRNGTDNGNWIIVAEAGETSETLATSPTLSRSNKNAQDITSLSYDIQNVVATTDNPLKIKLSIISLNDTKDHYVGNLVVTGTMTGNADTGTKYELTTSVSPQGAGTITVDPAMDSYKEGKEVSLTATKNFGYKFQKWTVNGTDYSTDATISITMNEPKNAVAVFESVPVYTVNTIVKNDKDLSLGKVTLTPNDHNGKYEAGTEVTVKAEESKILKFMSWEDNSTVNPRSITVDKDVTITANYEIQDFIAVFDASKSQAYDYTGAGFNADIVWDANRNATCKVVNVHNGTTVYSDKSGTPVVRNREKVVLDGINGLYQNGYRTSDIAWQYEFSTKGFTSAKFVADMAAKNMAHKSYKVLYSLDGTSFSDVEGAAWDITANIAKPIEFAIPADAIDKDMVYIRITGTGDVQLSSAYEVKGQFLGLDYYSNSESGVGNVFVLGEAVTEVDEVAPKLINTIPAADATGIPASGNIVLTYDEKIQLNNEVKGKALLNGAELTPSLSAKSVSFQYVNLEYGKTYTFTMPAGYVEDKSGNAADGVELTFTIMERQKPEARIFDAIVDKSLDLNYGESIGATETMPQQYRYIQDAINDAPDASTKPYLIYIKEGYYDDPNPYFGDSYGTRYTDASMTTTERIEGGKNQYDDCRIIFINKPNIHLIGQATDKVTIATDRLDGADKTRPELPWYHVNAGAAVEIQKGGDDAVLSTLTIDNENWTKDGKEGPQALCINTDADRLTFNELNVQSYQDDYKANGIYNRAFWYKSRFEGSVDYIYGDCDVWFEDCIHDINRKTGGYIVAPSHPEGTRWGYVFNNNVITSSMYGDDCQVWLGRPWHNYPKTVFMNTRMETKAYDGYWYETMGGLPALWAVKNLTDKNGTAMSEVSRSTYYANAADGEFAPGTYTSKTDNGDGTFKYVNDNTKNSLTDAEFAEYTIQNVLAGDKSTNATGYWNPLTIVEKTAVPEVAEDKGVITWTTDEYAICYVVTVNGVPAAFTTAATYLATKDDKITVQSVNENGVLSMMSAEVIATATAQPTSIVNRDNGTTRTEDIYTIGGLRLQNTQRGINIIRMSDGTVKKVVRK